MGNKAKNLDADIAASACSDSRDLSVDRNDYFGDSCIFGTEYGDSLSKTIL